MVDVDHFKRVNDEFGHAAGNKVLQTVAATLKSNLRDIDLLARLGGEEFAIVLPGANTAATSATAERLRAAVEAVAAVHEGRLHQAMISLGVAALGSEGFDPGMALADACLYAAKAAGRNRVVDR